MSSDNALIPPPSSPSLGDIAHAMVVKAAVSAIPLVGPFASELAQMVVVSPAQRRTQDFLEQVVERIHALEEKGVSPSDLASDEGFQDVLAAAIDAGRRNASEEKRSRLLACIDSAAALDVPAGKQRFYVRCVEDLTNGHFAVLQRFRSREFHHPQFSRMPDDLAQKQMLNRLGWPDEEGDYLSSLLLDLASLGLLVNRHQLSTSLGSNNFQRMEISATGAGLVDYVS